MGMGGQHHALAVLHTQEWSGTHSIGGIVHVHNNILLQAYWYVTDAQAIFFIKAQYWIYYIWNWHTQVKSNSKLLYTSTISTFKKLYLKVPLCLRDIWRRIWQVCTHWHQLLCIISTNTLSTWMCQVVKLAVTVLSRNSLEAQCSD